MDARRDARGPGHPDPPSPSCRAVSLWQDQSTTAGRLEAGAPHTVHEASPQLVEPPTSTPGAASATPGASRPACGQHTPCVRPRAAGPASRRVRRSAPIRASTARPWRTSCVRRPATREAECRSPSTRCGTSVQEGRCLVRRPCRACRHHKSASPCATARIRPRSGRQSGRRGRRSRGRRRGIINPSSGPTRAPRRRICGGGAYE